MSQRPDAATSADIAEQPPTARGASGLTAVAMSGGLDSSVAAWLLSRE